MGTAPIPLFIISVAWSNSLWVVLCIAPHELPTVASPSGTDVHTPHLIKRKTSCKIYISTVIMKDFYNISSKNNNYTHIAALYTSALISPQKYYCFFIGWKIQHLFTSCCHWLLNAKYQNIWQQRISLLTPVVQSTALHGMKDKCGDIESVWWTWNVP